MERVMKRELKRLFSEEIDHVKTKREMYVGSRDSRSFQSFLGGLLLGFPEITFKEIFTRARKRGYHVNAIGIVDQEGEISEEVIHTYLDIIQEIFREMEADGRL